MTVRVFIQNEAGSDQKNYHDEKRLVWQRVATVSRATVSREVCDAPSFYYLAACTVILISRSVVSRRSLALARRIYSPGLLNTTDV